MQRTTILSAALHHRRCAALATVLATMLILSGCGSQPQTLLMHLDPKAPAASGLLPAPAANQPSPMLVRPPFGLYAQYPSDDTLKSLATGTLSPDGQFRFAVTAQGLWVTRVDAAWLWEVGLPPIPVPPPDSTKPAQPSQTPQEPKPRTLAGTPVWSDGGRLLLQDTTNAWFEASPVAGTVRTLPAVFTGAQELTPSPDGTQVFYYLNGKTGRQLWTAKADGTGAKLVGEKLTAHWDPVKKTLVTEAVAATPSTTKRTGIVAPRTTTPSRD